MSTGPFPDEITRLLAELSYRRGAFRLASGKETDFYVDVKKTVYTARGAALIGRILFDRLAALSIDLVGGMAVGAIPLVDAVLSEAGRKGAVVDGFFVRKEPKGHGTNARLDGRFDPSRRIALLEDVVTTGHSTLQALDIVEAAGGSVMCVLAVVDREEDGGLQRIAARVADTRALTTKSAIRRAAGEA
jgi:orotate phosphoribosyltransferase